MSEARPFHLPGASALAAVLHRTRVALDAWARDWLSGWTRDEPPLTTLRIEEVAPADLVAWREFAVTRGANGQIGFRRTASDHASFCQALLGAGAALRPGAAEDWLGEIADHAWSLRNRALGEALVGASKGTTAVTGAAWAARLAAAGSGAIKVVCEALGLHAIADGGVWSLVPPSLPRGERRPPLVPLDRALQRANLQVEVTLGSVELELPALMDLHVGDVLRLPARLDQPLTASCEGRPFARAQLGDARGSRAIQLTAGIPDNARTS